MSEHGKPPFNLSIGINTRDDETGKERESEPVENFCIAMLGNFSGSDLQAAGSALADRGFIEVDRYNLDEVMASMRIRLSLALDDEGGEPVTVALNRIKDFHPDSLYESVELFGRLRDLRERLGDPSTFRQALHELGVQEEAAGAEAAAEPSPEKPRPVAARSEPGPAGSLLDSILDATESQAPGGSAEDDARIERGSRSLVDAFVRQTVAGRRTVSRDARQDEMIAGIDEAIADQMRRLLHHPRFQAVEAAWRSVDFMTRRLRSGKAVKLYLLDVSRGEIETDLAVDDVSRSQLYGLFCDTAKGDIRWSLIIGDYRFADDIDDILLLSQLGAIADRAGARFIAAADEKLVGCDSFAASPRAEHWRHAISPEVEQAWTLLRRSPVANSISLALPRVLLRQPYGSRSAPTRAFPFEEMPGAPVHADYLWGNPAFLKAEQLARAFVKSGPEMNLAGVMDIEDLPAHYYEEGGQTVVKPCAEIPLADSGAAKMVAAGLIPMWSVKNADRVHSGDFHSIAA